VEKVTVTILFLLLITSCPTPFNPSSLDRDARIPADTGGGSVMGTLSLSIEGSQSQGRTIMPGTGAAGNQFPFYRLAFTGGPASSPALTIDRESSTIGENVSLHQGTYTLTVYGYTSEANRTANKPAAYATVNPLNIGNTPVNRSITLTLYGVGTTQGGKGIFDLNIDFPGDLSAIRMELEPVFPTTGSNVTYNFIGTGSIARDANLELDAGYYIVLFTLEKTGMRTVTWYEALHVYENMTSSYTNAFTNAHFVNAHSAIRFHYNDDVRTHFDISYFHDVGLTEQNNPADPTRTGFTFLGWYREPECINPMVYGPITSPVSLYAKWIENLTGTITLAFTNDDSTIEIQSVTGLNSGLNQGDLTYRWFWNGVLQPETTRDLDVGGRAGGNFRLEASHSDYYGVISAAIGTPLRGESADNPLLVNSLDALRRIGTDVFTAGGIWSKDAYYKQTANITVTSQVWTPISARSGNGNSFTGEYNGDGFLINNINWTSPSHFHDDLSIFGTIGTDGVVENIIAENPRITGRDSLGVIASVNRGIIRRSVAHNINVNGRNNIGGIAGENSGTTENCYTTGTVFGHGAAAEGQRVGGIAGLNSSTGTVQLCYSTATITGDNFVGGIVGQNNTGASVINNVALNPNITSRTTNAGRIGAGTGTFTNNRTRNDQAEYSIRITGGGSAGGERGTNLVASPTWTAVFPAGWTTGATGNWIFPATPTNLTVDRALPSLRMPTTPPPARLAPVPTLPTVRQRTIPNTATFNIDVRDFITFTRDGDEGYWLKPVTGNWVLGEMLEGRPSGPVPLPAAVASAITGQKPQTVAASTTIIGGNNANGNIEGLGYFQMQGAGLGGNQIAFDFDLVLNIPVVKAEVVFVIFGTDPPPNGPYIVSNTAITNSIHRNTAQQYFCERDSIMKFGWRYNNIVDNKISGRLSRPNDDFPQGITSMHIYIYIETYGDWTYLPDNNADISEPYVIFQVSESEYYWYDAERGQGQSSGMGAKDLFTSIEDPLVTGGDWILSFNPPEIYDFIISNNISQPIPHTVRPLYIRSASTDTGAVFYKKAGGPDRNRDGLLYNIPQAANHVPLVNANRITPNIVLDGTGEIVGRAEIILMRANTVASSNPSPYNFSTGAGNEVEVDIILHLNADFASDVSSIQLLPISIATITTPNFAGSANSERTLPPGVNNVLFRNTSTNATNISRFDRTSTAGSGLVFRFNY